MGTNKTFIVNKIVYYTCAISAPSLEEAEELVSDMTLDEFFYFDEETEIFEDIIDQPKIGE